MGWIIVAQLWRNYSPSIKRVQTKGGCGGNQQGKYNSSASTWKVKSRWPSRALQIILLGHFCDPIMSYDHDYSLSLSPSLICSVYFWFCSSFKQVKQVKRKVTHEKLSNVVVLAYCRGFSLRSILYFIQLMLMCSLCFFSETVRSWNEILLTNNPSVIEKSTLLLYWKTIAQYIIFKI